MNSFRTEIIIPPSPFKINHQSIILLIGSCFTENIGALLQEYKFNVDINPFGIVYNPISVLHNLETLFECKIFSKENLSFHNDLYFSFDHHGKFSDPDPKACLQRINENIMFSSKQLLKADYLIITFGTSWIYRHAETGRIVSNCHKLPSSHFNREILRVEEIVDAYISFIQRLLDVNPNLKIIFTVSPVRHWKDGAEQNTISKSTLILAIRGIMSELRSASYFPAYELAVDDLRDYRFYADDLVHPNNQMTQYIWEKFRETYMDEDTIDLMDELEPVIQAAKHKPFHPGSDSHKKFLNRQIKNIEVLLKKYPFLDFEKEKEYFVQKL